MNKARDLALREMTRAKATVTSDWDPVAPPPIDGVALSDVKNVVFAGGVLTELFREEWAPDFPLKHVLHVTMLPGQLTQWHCHKEQNDLIFPVRGQIRIGLYDDRAESPTRGAGCILNFNIARPRHLFVPKGVWHALKNASPGAEAAYVVMNDVEYDYDHPDDWTLAPGSPDIPISMG
jgi:dTDP-4-dehydrorhamnose 3,5-epimerase